MLVAEETLYGARCVLADRRGGVSAAPYDAANLALHTGDAADGVQTNRDLLRDSLGSSARELVFAEQVHGTRVRVVAGAAPARELGRTDGLVTTARGVALAMMGADCPPVLLVAEGVVGAAHVGRAGLVGGVLREVVRAMRGEGAQAMAARIGPGICGRCYEVPEALAADVEAQAPGSRSATRAGRPSVDLAAGIERQLADLGVTDVEQVGGCTYEQPDHWYSYRRDGVTGRHAGVVLLP